MEETRAMEAWRALAEKALKGAPLDSLDTPLASITGGEGWLAPFSLPAPPLYAGRAVVGRWQLVQRVDDDAAAATQALEDLENGATALALVFAGAPSALGRGLTAASVDALDEALDAVRLDLIGLHIEAGAAARAALANTVALIRRRGTLPTSLHAGIDPVGSAAFGGRAPALEDLGEAIAVMDEAGLDGTALGADGRIAAEAGANPADELAFAVSSLLAMLSALDRAGIPAEAALPRISVALCADEDQFVTIAKLRAMRRLHAFIAAECGVSGVPLALHATTAARMLSFTDPHTNLLRLTIAAMAAAQGGADAITVLPFDRAASPFGRRMARNIQSLMLEESHVARLSDPGAGSGTIETLTETLAEAAWKAVTEHAADDYAAWLTDGTFAARAAKAAARERTIIGVTRHPPAEPVKTAAPPEPEPAAGTTPNGPLAALLEAAAEGATLDMRAPPAGPHALAPQRAAARHEG